jgi:elongation factor G
MRKPIKNRPILSAVFSAETDSGSTRFREAFTEIAKQDSTIEINSEPTEERAVVAAMSATHLEEIRERFLDEYGLLVSISGLKVIYLETIRKKAEAEGKYIRQTGGSGNYGHCKLRVEPNEPDKGYEFINDIKGGVVPNEYIKSIDEGVQGALELGIVAGFPIVDVKVTLFDGSYHEEDSNEMAFKFAGSIALKEAARKAYPVLLEPVMAVEVTVPEEQMGIIISDINSRRGRIEGMEHLAGSQLIKTIVPLSEMLGSHFPGLAEYSMEFAGYEEVHNRGGFDGMDPGVPAILPKVPNQGRGSAAARLESETE